ncbi:A nuclease family of the HNH/ENDO VII superfamily with conserved AHH [Butyrivibrio hungatei]|uniref:A nuclease family of the HNH/ENDO VII superfamily with conserved AHH n=1 Tax=Butyrivibrio hungatei TaxID=185008 RepID=A0A1G5BD97_9FIRM|nr:DUF262 domain-containing protein [Butyrivibrio hungatei]SCX88084.1 A nuclease family of the HNH/ENDO VII superfamily with conserved AHH [Butyrivibrio hungatei]
MSEPKTTMNLQEIINEIEAGDVLLPDFQRKFVWTEEERQKKIVASILTKMPIGSILLLESDPSDYSSKVIGCKTIINANKLKNTVEFLLDGQQRITVLTNVFSNVIHNNCNKVSDLVSPTLKRRFFLCIPKWKNREGSDLFGVQNLNFPYKDPDSKDPDFLSGEIMPFIVCETFTAGDQMPYNPAMDLSTALDEYCLSNEEGYLLPLFLMTPSSEKNPSLAKLRLNTIRKNIAEKITQEIENHFESLTDSAKKQAFIDELFIDDKKMCEAVKKDYTLLGKKLSERAEVWEGEIKEYLDSCVKNIVLNKIVVSAEKRARAIDIYENLNIGGVCLNIFDLIMAKVAKVDNAPYYERLIGFIKSEKEYTKSVIPDTVASLMKHKVTSEIDGVMTAKEVDMLEDKYYNASLFTKCYNEDKNEINPKFIDAFLNTLSLYTYNPSYKPDEYKVDHIKRNKILELTPEDIHSNTEKICCAIDRALFFFQTRCGIRSINELNYSLMISLVATVFTNDSWYADINVHKKLEAWYWSSLFSGNYDRDQNTIFIQDLQSVMDMLTNTADIGWISKNIDYILDAQNFSDESLLLMEKVQEERYPKRVLRIFMCQYLLAKTYADMFDPKITISVFSNVANALEAHHIIPLGSVKKMDESTEALRKDDKNICNSPINFVYITKKSNDEISDDTLDVYITKITDEAKSTLSIQSYTTSNIDEDNTKQILKQRYTALKGDIKTHVRQLLQ